MFFKKLLGPEKIQSLIGGEERTIPLRPISGGHLVKRVQYMIVVTDGSGVDLRIGLRFDHGPDGMNFLTHSTPIAYANPGSEPAVMEGTVDDSTTMIGEWLQPVILIKHNTAASTVSAIVCLYEMRKPF